MQVTGECMYCKQAIFVNVEESASEEAIKRAATLLCNCDPSLRYQKINEAVEHAKVEIKELFEDNKGIQLILDTTADQFMTERIEKVSITRGSTKAVISINAKHEIKVEKIRTEKAVRTV